MFIKVGSVFGFLHPETAVSVSVFSFKKTNKKSFFLKIENRNCGFGLEAKSGCLCLLLHSMTTLYYVVVKQTPSYKQKINKKLKTENWSVLKESLKKVKKGFKKKIKK